jgi:RNA polymerase sigma factor (sigma-70 family)
LRAGSVCASICSSRQIPAWLEVFHLALRHCHQLPEGEDGRGGLETLLDRAALPGEQMEAGERAAQVRAAVQALPEELRTPLLLFEYENLTQIEIGEILHCTAKAVEVRIYRARNLLRKSLASLGLPPT